MLKAHGLFIIYTGWKSECVLIYYFSDTGHSVVNRKPVSRIFHAKTTLGSQPAPRVAGFSSKGPNALTPEILKVRFLSRNSFGDAGFCNCMFHSFS